MENDFFTKEEKNKIFKLFEKGVPVVVCGEPGSNKFARVRELDEDFFCFNGYRKNIQDIIGSEYEEELSNKKRYFRPSWLVFVEGECNENTDKNYILVFDLSQTSREIQNIILNIVETRIVNNKAGFKLPSNCSIMLLTNNKKELVDGFKKFTSIECENLNKR